MSLSTTRLVNSRVRVTGTDIEGTDGVQVLDSIEWDEVNQHRQFHSATKEFDAAVEAHFATITEAAEKLAEASQSPAADPMTFIVFNEEVPGVKGRQAVVRHFHNPDTVILRVLESGDHSRLVWVDGRLELLATLPVHTPGTSPSDVAAAQAEVQAQEDRVEEL
jgi:hypothetical protein